MGIPFLSDTNFVDDAELSFGNSSDLKIYHSGSHSYISDVGTGNLLISGTNLWLSDAATGENFLRATSNGAVQIYYDGAFKFATTNTGVDVNGTINLDNLTINGAQGSNGQVLTSTGTGIAWEDAAGGASLSGGEASKVAVWSATDTLTHNDNFHFDTTNVRLGIGDSNPNRTLVVSETRTGSTASDAYTAIVKSVQSSGASPNPGTGGLKVQYTSSSSNVHAFGLVAGSSSSDFLTTGPMHFYTNSDLDTVSATGFAMQLDTSQRLILGSMTASQKLNVSGNVLASRYYSTPSSGNYSTQYYIDPNDSTTSAVLNADVAIGDFSTPAHRLVVRTPGGESGNTEDGVFIKSPFAGGSPVATDAQPFLSIGCRSTSGGVSRIFLGQNATATSQESLIEYSRDNGTLGVFVKGMGTYTEHVRFGNQSSGTARTRFYGNVGIGTDPSAKLHVNDGFLKVQPPDISGTTPPSITISSLTNQYQSGIESSGHLTMKSSSSGNFYWYKGSTSAMYYTDALYVNKIVDKDATAFYLDPSSSGVSLHINGIIDQDFSVTDLNSAWTAPGTSRDQGFIFGRFQSNASNKPATNDNANWFANIYSHGSGGTASYGIQLAGSNAGSGENALQLRNVSNGSFASWRKVYHEGHKPTYSELGTMDYTNLTGTPTHPNISGATSVNNSGNGFIQDLTFDSNGHVTGVTSASVSGFLTSESDTLATVTGRGATTTTRSTFSGGINTNTSSTRDKISVYTGAPYVIGMQSGITYGHLNDWGMTFQFNDDNDRGFWWGDSGHSTAQGAMSLTTNGRLTVAESISVGQGQSITSAATHPLYVDGTAVFDTTGNTEPVCISRSGSVASEVLKIGVQDTAVQFNYIEDTSSEGTGNFGRYDFILGGNSSETSVTALKLEKTKTTSNAGAFTFGTPGNGTNTLGRWLSFEGNTDSSGEGSGRLFFTEHNSSTTDMDDYGMSIGYRGGSTSVTTAGGNTWTGLSQIGNGQWGMWGHNNSLAGALIMYGDRAATFVNFAGNNITGVSDLTTSGPITIDSAGHATVSLDRASTSYDNNLIYRTAGTIKWRLWQDGSDDYLYVRNESGSNNLMTFRSNNTVGINTGTPNATLHLQIPGAGSPSIFLQSAYNYSPGIYFDDSNTGTNAAGAITYLNANNTFNIKANSSSVITISSGTTTISATADIVAYSSDKRLKENVQPIDKPLNKVLELEGVTYNWNKKAEDVAGFDTEIKEVGLFAQDVQKVLPEAVKLAPFDTGEDFKSKSGEDYLTVQYEKIVPLLVEAIKDQQKQIDELKSIINGGS